MKGFFDEFKKFIMRGNVLDMAVGVIIGGAFTAIVTSLNTDIFFIFLATLLPYTSFITLRRFPDPSVFKSSLSSLIKVKLISG